MAQAASCTSRAAGSCWRWWWASSGRTACTVTVDSHGAGGFLYIASSAFLLALVVGIFWQNNMYYLIISVVGAILFSAYLLYDIQARLMLC